MKIRNLVLISLFIFIAPVIPLQAQQGLMLLEKGSAKVIGPKRTILLRKPGSKMVLQADDRVQTGKESSVKIKIKGKPEMIELSSRAFFRMGKITQQTSSISLLTGKARFKIKGKLKRKSKKKRFQIRTVTALVGVRGTDFVVGASNTETSLLTISGSVSVAPVTMPDIEILVPENQASSVQQNATPTTPVKVEPKMRQQILKADSPKAFRGVKFGKAVNPEEVRKQNEKKKKEIEFKDYFLSVGRLTKQKNFLFLCKGFKKIVETNKSVKLVIIGEGEDKLKLKNFIKKNDLEENIILAGYRENIFPYFKKAKAFILPSLWEDPGFVLIEAAYCRTLVLSSNAWPGPIELIENEKNGIIFENNNLENFLNRFNSLMNFDDTNFLKINNLKKCRNFTIFNHYKTFDKLLSNSF